jgi:uncharacterized membrane protein
MRPILLSALAALVVSACSPDIEKPAGRTAETGPAPVLAGVDLARPVRVLGNEPFWAVEMTGADLVYSGPDRPEQRAPQPAPALQGTVATWEATTSIGTSLKITLTATDCSDGMSDRTYPLSAIVKVGDETLTGCAASVAALATAGESGRVVEG